MVNVVIILEKYSLQSVKFSIYIQKHICFIGILIFIYFENQTEAEIICLQCNYTNVLSSHSQVNCQQEIALSSDCFGQTLHSVKNIYKYRLQVLISHRKQVKKNVFSVNSLEDFFREIRKPFSYILFVTILLVLYRNPLICLTFQPIALLLTYFSCLYTNEESYKQAEGCYFYS